MVYRQCVANHWLAESQRGLLWPYPTGKREPSKKAIPKAHAPLHFESLMEEDLLSISIKEGSPLSAERLI